MTLVYISVGSNLCSPKKQIYDSINLLRDIPHSRVISVSSCYQTAPLGPQDQNDYMNIAIILDTKLTPKELLYNTQYIELRKGRTKKTERWGPRILDIDIMLFGNEIIHTNSLTIPHYDMKNRSFMLLPLFEIAPKLCFPDGETIEKALFRISRA